MRNSNGNDLVIPKTIGWLFLWGAIGVFIPYTILTISFDYPDILRQDPGLILTKFYHGGSSLILTWWFFAILGLPLLVAYNLIGKKLDLKTSYMSWITSIGVIGLICQMIGLLRWAFVVPVIAKAYILGSESTKEIAKIAFQVVHQFGGVILGEHIGQLFTIVWVIGVSRVFETINLMPKWIIWLGYGSSLIYLFAQADLFATVMPTFPMWEMAGFIGSTLWLIWLVAIGVKLILIRKNF